MGLFSKLYPHFAQKWDPILLNTYCTVMSLLIQGVIKDAEGIKYSEGKLHQRYNSKRRIENMKMRADKLCIIRIYVPCFHWSVTNRKTFLE